MSRDELAKEASVGRNTVARFETGRDINESTRLAIRRYFEMKGLDFTDANAVRQRP